MISYLQKFNNLDPALKAKVSGEKTMAAMRELEGKYHVKLATVVMRLMVKDVSILDLSKFLKFEYEMDLKQAEELVEELKEKVLWQVAEHLGFSLDDEPSDTIGAFKSGLGASTIKTSDFFFSPEDEDEVKELTRKLESYEPESKIKKEEDDNNLDQMATRVRQMMHVNFSAEELNDRFKTIIKTYLKGVRNRIDSKQSMMKPVDSGGLDFNEDLSSRALKIADGVKTGTLSDKTSPSPATEAKNSAAADGFSSRLSPVRPDQASARQAAYAGLGKASLRDVEYDFSKLKEKETKAPESAGLKPLGFREINDINQVKDAPSGSSAMEPGTGPVSEQKEPTFKIDLEALRKAESGALKTETKSEIPVPRIGERPGFSPIDQIQPMLKRKETTKPLVEDVKFVPRLTGPIEELADMSLTDFRRLGINAIEIVAKILEKIENLEKESYEKRLLGIQAWRKSPVNKIYLALAEESIRGRKKVSELIVEWREEGREVLKPEEFSAVLDLNKKIRF